MVSKFVVNSQCGTSSRCFLRHLHHLVSTSSSPWEVLQDLMAFLSPLVEERRNREYHCVLQPIRHKFLNPSSLTIRYDKLVWLMPCQTSWTLRCGFCHLRSYPTDSLPFINDKRNTINALHCREKYTAILSVDTYKGNDHFISSFHQLLVCSQELLPCPEWYLKSAHIRCPSFMAVTWILI